MSVDFSLIVPSAGDPSRLRRTLHSLALQDGVAGLRHEIVVVLDGWTPPAGTLEGGPTTRVVRSPQQRGRGAARNLGARYARGDVVLFIDADMFCLPTLLAAHAHEQAIQACLCAGPIRELPVLSFFGDLDTLVSAHGTRPRLELQIRAQRTLEQLSESLEFVWASSGRRSRVQRDAETAHAQDRSSTRWLGFSGANVSVPRGWLAERGFDERPGTRWGLEDLAFALQLALARRPLTSTADGRALHLSHAQRNWQADHEGNRMCLDFLDAQSADMVIDYLNGTRTLVELDRWFEPLFTRATGGI